MSNQALFRQVSQITVPYQGWVTPIAIADFNQDGKLDVVFGGAIYPVVNQAIPFGAVSVSASGQLSESSGSLFATPPTAINGRVMAIGDFNEDGKPDIFSANTGIDMPPYTGEPNTLLLSGPDNKLHDASSNLPQINQFNHGVAVGDVNHDGHLDAVVTSLSVGSTVYTLLGDGSGHFAKVSNFAFGGLDPTSGSTPTQVALVDVNGDGSLDMVGGCSSYAAGALIVSLNDGHGNFAKPIVGPAGLFGSRSTNVNAITTVDLNHDGRIDVVLGESDGSWRGQRLQFLLNGGDGQFVDATNQYLPVQPGTSNDIDLPCFLYPTDLNADGSTDLVVSIGELCRLSGSILYGQSGGFSVSTSNATVEVPLDYDHDGRPDLVTFSIPSHDWSVGSTATYESNTITVYHNDGADDSSATITPDMLGHPLTVPQQLEMLYVTYFNRAADGAGFNFWQGQNTQALAAGHSPSQVLANIADAFTPQPETFALYPFLSTPNLNLQSPASVTGLTNVVTAIYGNLFDRAPDAAGLSYWVHQLSTGAIPLGEAALAIANGALGSDVTEVLNKITVALDFTTRTGAAGSLVNAPATLIPAARSVLHGVDSTSLNDASVTAGENATTTYINGATTSSASAAVASLSSASDTVIVSTSNTVIDPGAGSHTIQFIAGVSADTVVLHSGGTDQIAGFDLAGGDVLDVRSLLAEAHLTPQDVLPNLGAYFTIADQGSNAVLRFDSTGHGGGNAVAILDNLGGAVTSFSSLTSHNAVQI